MQNTIVKEFEGNPDVVTLVFDQGGSSGETAAWFRSFWESVFLRGTAVFDATGTVSLTHYGQPRTNLPFGRGFIVDQNGRVVKPYFGHQPAMVIDTIYGLLPVFEDGFESGDPSAWDLTVGDSRLSTPGHKYSHIRPPIHPLCPHFAPLTYDKGTTQSRSTSRGASWRPHCVTVFMPRST